MRNIIIGVTAYLLTFSAYGDGVFIQGGVTLANAYKKTVSLRNGESLSGVFFGLGGSVKAGYIFDRLSIAVDYSPEQDVEIKSENELAKASMAKIMVEYAYLMDQEKRLLLGGFVGYGEFELVRGKGGATFDNNPKATGLTLGGSVEYQHFLTNDIYLSGYTHLGVIRFSGDGAASTPVQSIAVDFFLQAGAMIGYQF